MKKVLPLVIAMVLVLAAAVSAKAYMPGDPVEDFTVTLCDGSVFTLSEELEDHDCVLINIWAGWCGPCRAEMPYLEQAYRLYEDRVSVVCLSAFDTNEDIVLYKAENGLTDLPMGYDAVGLTDRLVQEGYPTSVIVDRYGNYARYECGAMLSAEQFTGLFDRFTGEDYDGSDMEVTYRVFIRDENGQPVSGVGIRFFDSEGGIDVMTAEDGVIGVIAPTGVYYVQLTELPEGYTGDLSCVYETEDRYLFITVKSE